MNRPPEHVIEAVAPTREVDDLPINDSGVRNVAHAELRDTLRLPRGGEYEATLVAVKKFYDGANGGEAGHYLMAWVEFRHGGSRWRTPGVKIRAVEALRISKAIVSRKPSVPGRNEPERVGGKLNDNDESSLRGAPVGRDGYIVYIRSKNPRNETWSRTRGIEVSAVEAPFFAELLKKIAKAGEEG